MSKGGGGGGFMYPSPTIQSSNTNTSSNIPDWLTQASQAGVANAGKMLNQSTPNYTGQLAPGLSADQISAANMVRGSVGAYQPYYDKASNLTQASTAAGPAIQAQTFQNGLQGAINDYMNPYIKNVTNQLGELSQYNLAKSLNQTNDQAIGAHAFGGSRHGVQEGIATAENNFNTNNQIANLLNSGYNQATSLMGQDISNNLAAQGQNQNAFNSWMNRLSGAGNQMANIGTSNRAANVADINNLNSMGAQAQQTQAAQDQAAYQNWLWQQQYPQQMQQLYNQTVSTAPHSTSGTSNTTSIGFQPIPQNSTSPLMTGLGGAMAGAQLGNMFPGIGTAIGAAGGGLLGMFGGLR